MHHANETGRVRADLTARVAALDVRLPYIAPAALVPELEAIRRIAHHAGLDPAVTVTHFLDVALVRGAGPIHGWLALLATALAAESHDLATCDAFAVACSQRLAA